MEDDLAARSADQGLSLWCDGREEVFALFVLDPHDLSLAGFVFEGCKTTKEGAGVRNHNPLSV